LNKRGRSLASKSLWRRPEGVGFYAMLMLSLPFSGYFSLTTKTYDWLFAVVFFTVALGVFMISWWIFWFTAYRPTYVPMEKVEFVCFWTMIPASMIILLAGYAIISVFSYSLLYTLAAGVLSYCIVYVHNLFAK
jgi:hypothetical protein